MTLLQLGKNSWVAALENRETLYQFLIAELVKLEEIYKIKILKFKKNNIQTAIELHHPHDSNLGAKLFTRGITGCRYINPKTVKSKTFEEDFSIQNWGSHRNDVDYWPYLTVAVGIGMEKIEILNFVKKLCNLLDEEGFRK